MRVLFVSSEVAPFSKTGGLGDVAGALPRALVELGIDVTIVTPRYRGIRPENWGFARRLRTLAVPIGATLTDVTLFEGRLPGSRAQVFMVDCPTAFDRDGLYGVDGQDHPDNAWRFALLSRAALEIARTISGEPDVVHAHDWQAGLACHWAKQAAVPPATLLTIHNLAFQGLFPKETLDVIGLGWDGFHPGGFEFYGQLSLLKAGIVASDALSTVSPRYAREIQTPAFGCGFEGVLAERKAILRGILNGIDTHVWNPAQDPHLAKPYHAAALEGKADCKRALQKRLGLPARGDVLLLGAISRLTHQKGCDLLLEIADALTALDVQVAVLGSGDATLQSGLRSVAQKHPNKIAVEIAYDEGLAHQIEAGADAFLMPSRFEPCGLNQMYSLRYGTLPIVRATGGLDDTVVDWDGVHESGTGFKFDELTGKALFEVIRHAACAWQVPKRWRSCMLRGMRQDFSWGASARRYAQLYEEITRGSVSARRRA